MLYFSLSTKHRQYLTITKSIAPFLTSISYRCAIVFRTSNEKTNFYKDMRLQRDLSMERKPVLYKLKPLRDSIFLMLSFALVSQTSVAAEDLKFSGNLTWISAYVHLIPDEDNALNRENDNFLIPENNLVSEIRPNLKITSNSFQLVVRPKVVAEVSRVKIDEKYEEPKGKTSSTINEAFFNWGVSNAVTFSYGRQSYQWGAAESISPSNRIFHETSQSKNILYEVIGKDIARLNFTIGKAFSTVVMTEFQENEDQEPFRYEEEFVTKGLLKSEFAWNDGTDYFGVVFGGVEGGRGWFGEYFSLQVPFIDGLFLYGDASHQRGSAAWYPMSSTSVLNQSPVVQLEQSKLEDDKVHSMVVGGLKYDFENGTILRAEYIKNDAGYTEEERNLFYASLANSSPAQLAVAEKNIAAFQRTGLEFPGQKYWYTSAQVPDFLKIKDLTFYLRALYSETDHSASGYSSIDYLVGDAGTVSFSSSGDLGRPNTELRSAIKNSYALAYKHNW